MDFDSIPFQIRINAVNPLAYFQKGVKPNFNNSDYHGMIFIIGNIAMYPYFYTRVNEEDFQLLFV